MDINSITYSEVVPSPVFKDYLRGVWVNFIIALVCMGALWSNNIPAGWCIISFLFLGPFNPNTLYSLHIPWGIEFTETTVKLFYSVLFLKRSKTMNTKNVSFIIYDEGTPERTRLELLVKKTKGAYRRITFLQRNKWSLSIQKRIVSYATNKGIIVLHY